MTSVTRNGSWVMMMVKTNAGSKGPRRTQPSLRALRLTSRAAALFGSTAAGLGSVRRSCATTLFGEVSAGRIDRWSFSGRAALRKPVGDRWSEIGGRGREPAAGRSGARRGAGPRTNRLLVAVADRLRGF